MNIENLPEVTRPATFRAALIGETTSPDRDTRLLLPEGRELYVTEGCVFKILDDSTWKEFFTPEETRITGPALISVPRVNEKHRGVFSEYAKQDHKEIFSSLGLFALAALAAGFTMSTWPIFSILLAVVALAAFGIMVSILFDRGSILFDGQSKVEKEIRQRVMDHDIFPNPISRSLVPHQVAAE